MLNKTLVLFCILLSVNACKSRKNKKNNTTLVPVKIDTAVTYNAKTLLEPAFKNWSSFSARIDVEFSSGDDKKSNPSASIRMLKDSLIWISAGMFGIEGARILINKDSAVLLNKLEKTYTVYKAGALSGITDIPLDISQLQNLLLARPVYALELYKDLIMSDKSVLIRYDQKKISTTHTFEKSHLTIDTTLLSDRSTPNYARAVYSSYLLTGVHNFATETFITITGSNKIYYINLKYTDMEFDIPLTFPFTIPSTYEKTK